MNTGFLSCPEWVENGSCIHSDHNQNAEAVAYRTERAGLPADGDCHLDCGPIVNHSDDGQHAHNNRDGICWHDNEDSVT